MSSIFYQTDLDSSLVRRSLLRLSLLLSLMSVGCEGAEDLSEADVDFNEALSGTMVGGGDSIFAPMAGTEEISGGDCTLRATVAIENDEGEDFNLDSYFACLDRLDLSDGGCGLEERISEEINNISLLPGQVVICTDRDADCYYHCPGWKLPASLEDRDDRRATILGDVDARQMFIADSITPPSNGSGYIAGEDGGVDPQAEAPPPEFSLNCLESIYEGKVCHYLLGDEEAELESLWACDHDGIALVSRSESVGLTLTLGHLIQNEQLLQRTKIPLDFVPGAVACHRNDSNGSWSVIIADSELGQVYRLLEGRFAPYNLISSAQDFIVSIGLNVDLSAEPHSTTITELSSDTNAFQWWRFTIHLEMSDALMPVLELFGMRIAGNAPHYQQLPAEVIDLRLSCQGCNADQPTPRQARLLSDLSVTVSDGEEELGIFEVYGPFRMMRTSESLLGLGEELERNELIYFSLWTEPLSGDDSLINFPLVFDALARGYESVELIEIKGMNALLSLTEPLDQDSDPEEQKRFYAVYHVLTDRFIRLDTFFTKEQVAAFSLMGEDSLSEIAWSKPSLYSTWVSQIAKYQEKSYILMLNLDE